VIDSTVSVGAIADRLRSVGIGVTVVGNADVAVWGMTHDSRAVQPGQVFTCFRGDRSDGHTHAAQAVISGASALLVDHVLSDVGTATQLVVADTRLAVGPAAAAAWGDPSERLTTVGITGTNGKTTTAQIVASMLEDAGVSTGIIGTLHGPRTTPEAPDLHAALAEFEAQGRRAVVMEVSSHALELHRVDGTVFDVVAFTNFGHDHLDLHGSPEAYFRAKSALFTALFSHVAVVNVTDVNGCLLADTISDRDGDDVMRVVRVTGDDVTDVVVGAASHTYRWKGLDVAVGLGGHFNVTNSLLALNIVDQLDVDLAAAIAGLSNMAAVPGRFEIVADADEHGFTVVVDYAHTPDGLEVLLASARQLTDNRVIAVFGCAGLRDNEKRPVMGEVAGRLSDLAIATSDNPRGEDPEGIINDVIAGVAGQYRSRVTSEPDRRLAISEALDLAQPGDVVVIAGKGHESTQDLGDRVIDFDDRTVVRQKLQDAS
jgi:UDP-N-acetylmuramoyl-L-alanyl-D-glutamate--2,6-diaminopimelate ligase